MVAPIGLAGRALPRGAWRYAGRAVRAPGGNGGGPRGGEAAGRGPRRKGVWSWRAVAYAAKGSAGLQPDDRPRRQ
ncbi:hypothetical protein GCM10010496_64620 [Streptomyces asoensis]|nr:hypothetical protein GCM10010496_64620 [Streptomyces asoensis]